MSHLKQKRPEASPFGLPLRGPKALFELLFEAQRNCKRLSGLDGDAVYDLLTKFRHGFVRVEGLTPWKRDLIKRVSLDLYVALHDWDRSYAMIHSLRNERDWLWGRGVKKLHASAPSLPIARERSKKKRTRDAGSRHRAWRKIADRKKKVDPKATLGVQAEHVRYTLRKRKVKKVPSKRTVIDVLQGRRKKKKK